MAEDTTCFPAHRIYSGLGARWPSGFPRRWETSTYEGLIRRPSSLRHASAQVYCDKPGWLGLPRRGDPWNLDDSAEYETSWWRSGEPDIFSLENTIAELCQVQAWPTQDVLITKVNLQISSAAHQAANRALHQYDLQRRCPQVSANTLWQGHPGSTSGDHPKPPLDALMFYLRCWGCSSQ